MQSIRKEENNIVMKAFFKDKKVQNIIGGLFFIIFFGWIIITGQANKRKLKDGPSNYTIATITEFSYGSKVAPWFDYKFEVKKQVYKGCYSIADKMGKLPSEVLHSYVGKRFYVKFYVADPDINELLIYSPIPDSIKSAPEGGWKPRR